MLLAQSSTCGIVCLFLIKCYLLKIVKSRNLKWYLVQSSIPFLHVLYLNTTRNRGVKIVLVGWILILTQYRLHRVSEICNLQGPRELLILQSRWDLSSLNASCVRNLRAGGGGGTVLQQWVLASNNSLHSINCMELYCAINHKLIMIMLQC